MEEIDIKEVLYYMWKKKLLIVAFLIIGIVLACIYTKYLVTPMYKSYTTVVLSSNDDSTITQSDITLNQKLLYTYNELIKSRTIAEQVISELNLDISESEIMSNISVSSVDDTELIKIEVSNKDPDTAVLIANTVVGAFSDYVQEIYNIENITVIDKAIASDTPYNINYTKNIALFACFGGVVAAMIIFLLYYFDTKIKSKKQVEDLLGLEVLSVIPDIHN